MARFDRFAVLAFAGLASATSADATSVTFAGTVANLCVLTLTTPGALGIATDGKTLSSQNAGGVKAVMAVVASGTTPTISFTAPTMTGPAASVGSASKEIAYTSPGGAAQAFTSGASTYSMNRLLETLTIDARAENSSGFASGAYTLSSTATCQQ